MVLQKNGKQLGLVNEDSAKAMLVLGYLSVIFPLVIGGLSLYLQVQPELMIEQHRKLFEQAQPK
jgi:hypothetical protein